MPTTCPTRVPARATTTLVAAARVVYLHDVVASLPKGYDTLVAERGHRLSTVLAADLIVELDRLGHANDGHDADAVDGNANLAVNAYR